MAEEFFKAIEKGQYTNVVTLYREEYINRRHWGNTALHLACSYIDEPRIVNFLIDKGWDIEANTEGFFEYGETPIHKAARLGLHKVLELLIKRKCSLVAKNKSGVTPIDVAITNKKSECTTLLQDAMKTENDIRGLNDMNLSEIVGDKSKTRLDELINKNNKSVIKAIKSKPLSDKEIQDFMSIDRVKVDPQSYRLLHECLLYRCIHQNNQNGFDKLSTPEVINGKSLFIRIVDNEGQDDIIVGPTALETATQYDRVIFVRLILQRLGEMDESWSRATKIAEKIKSTVIKTMISERIKFLKLEEEQNNTRLHIAVIENDPIMIDYILSNQNDRISYEDEVKAVNISYQVALPKCLKVIYDHHMEIYKRIENQKDCLVENIKNLDDRKFAGLTSLQLSVLGNCRNICEKLVLKAPNFDKFVSIDHQLMKIDPGLSTILSKPTFNTITIKETIYTLCIKVNRTVYPCLLQTINEDSINLTDSNGNTLLHLCAVLLLADLCTELMNKGANVNAENTNKITPLLSLLKENLSQKGQNMLIETINVLIDGGATVDEKDSNNHNVFHIGTLYNSESILLALIHKSQLLEGIDEPLWKVWLEKQHFTFIGQVIPLINKSLITKWISADVIVLSLTNSKNENEGISFVKILYDNAANDVRTTVIERILEKSANIGDEALFKELINDEIPTNSGGLSDGKSLLNVLILARKTEFCNIVLQSKNAIKFVNKKDSLEKLPIHICTENGVYEVANTIIKKTESIDDEDIGGNTALIFMFQKVPGRNEALVEDKNVMKYIKALIKRGAQIKKMNKHNRSNISYCKDPGIVSTIEESFEDQE